jgi:hypothetical protein
MHRRIIVSAIFVILGLTVLYVGLVNVEAAFAGDTRGCTEFEMFGPQIGDNGGIVYSNGACTEYRYAWETYTSSLLFGLGFVGFGSYRISGRRERSDQ